MPYVGFREFYPDLAERETRSITVAPDSDIDLPPDDYGFIEMYCNERGCDCRRVLFYVIARSREGVQAVIGWGWEDVEFYARWMHSDDRTLAALMKGPAQNPMSPATEMTPALVKLVRNVLLKDPEYVERIKRHYQMVREKVDAPKKHKRRIPKKRR